MVQLQELIVWHHVELMIESCVKEMEDAAMNTKMAFQTPEGKTAILGYYDAMLEKWSFPLEKQTVTTRYGEVFLLACGDKKAPPLLLLHGSAFNSMMWLGDLQEYSRNYRVYAIDLPGEPGRSDEHQLPFDGPAYADWLYDVTNALSIEKASLVGISLGAWLCIKFALNYPHKVEKLVLLCPAGVGPQKKPFLLAAILHAMRGERGMDQLYAKVNGNQPLPEEVLLFQRLIGKHFNFRRESIPLFSDSELRRLTMPTNLFVGKKDIMLHSLKTAKRLGRMVPHAQINVIENAGHTLINLYDQIFAFLNRGS